MEEQETPPKDDFKTRLEDLIKGLKDGFKSHLAFIKKSEGNRNTFSYQYGKAWGLGFSAMPYAIFASLGNTEFLALPAATNLYHYMKEAGYIDKLKSKFNKDKREELISKLKPHLNPFLRNLGVAVNLFTLGAAGLVGLNAASIPFVQDYNQSIKPKQKTVVFTSGWDWFTNRFVPVKSTAKVIDFFMYTPVTLRQNLMGNQVDWHSCATKEDVLENLANEGYQNVVFIGHGDNEGYMACDKSVTHVDIFRRGVTPKKGELIQYTCGRLGDKNLRNVLLKDPKKGFAFNHMAGPELQYLAAWYHLFTGEQKMKITREEVRYDIFGYKKARGTYVKDGKLYVESSGESDCLSMAKVRALKNAKGIMKRLTDDPQPILKEREHEIVAEVPLDKLGTFDNDVNPFDRRYEVNYVFECVFPEKKQVMSK